MATMIVSWSVFHERLENLGGALLVFGVGGKHRDADRGIPDLLLQLLCEPLAARLGLPDVDVAALEHSHGVVDETLRLQRVHCHHHPLRSC